MNTISTKTFQWKTGSFEFEGFPLLLRFPSGLDYDSLKPSYPKLITVSHLLEKVQNNGLPELDYNKSLNDFDDHLVGEPIPVNDRITVLVETFGGKRNYYIYCIKDISIDSFEKQLCEMFPNYRLEVNSEVDKEWSFIKRYEKDWLF